MTRDAHSRTSEDAPEPLYDENVPTPTHAERARTLVAGIGTATLCTVALDPAGYPYGSFVTLALDGGQPVFLISALAEHTKNLIRDSRASVLLAENGAADPLANGRVTLVGECARLDGDGGTARSAFLETHPNAGYYADFKDFSFWKMDVQSVRYIGGYGRMSWVTREDWLASEPDPLVADAAKIVDHMNEDHADAVVSYCHAFSRATEISEACMTGVDRYGFEISAITAEGPRPVRVAFRNAVTTSREARKALIALLEQARELSRLTS
jgi:putative heme iron utilization protein